MNANLKLDMYVNGKEYAISEAPVSNDGFESILNSSAVINPQIANDLRSDGAAKITADMLSENMLNVLWDITNKEIVVTDEINFCMCIWNNGEHIQSLVSIDQI